MSQPVTSDRRKLLKAVKLLAEWRKWGLLYPVKLGRATDKFIEAELRRSRTQEGKQ